MSVLLPRVDRASSHYSRSSDLNFKQHNSITAKNPISLYGNAHKRYLSGCYDQPIIKNSGWVFFYNRDSNARHFKDLKFDPELEKLITDYRKRFELSGKKIETALPSVIQAETNSRLTPFSAEDSQSIEDEAKIINVLLKVFNGEEGDIIANYRLTQGKFRKILLIFWGYRHNSATQ